MAAEHRPADAQFFSAPPPDSSAALPSLDPSPIDIPSNPPKRQRRPSVRLGEIGGTNLSLRSPRDSFARTSKTRPLTNLVNGGADSNYPDNSVDLSLPRQKPRRAAKRARSNWTKIEPYASINEGNNHHTAEFGELDGDDSDTPMLREQDSPTHSGENMGILYWDQHRRESRGRVTGSNEANLGVRDWLIGLGLGKYAPVFEIHEVDEEVLPMLTFEDLKDMGIAAVGSRRKIFLAINKLRKGFS